VIPTTTHSLRHDARPKTSSRPERLWRDTLQRLAHDPDGDLALSLHLPFCATHCLCCDREVRPSPPSAEVSAYVDALLDEQWLLTRELGARRDVTQLQFVGGCLTELGEVAVLRLFDGLHARWRIDARTDVSVHVEARRLGPGLLRLFAARGVTRLVMGVHDFDDRVQEAVSRRQSLALVADACAQARACGIAGVELDLMIGLPQQTAASWTRTLEQVLALAPQRVRLRHYRHRPRLCPVQTTFEAAAMPDRTLCRQMEWQARRHLEAAGHRPLGTELYQRGDQPLPSNDASLPWLGTGAGATSRVGGRVFYNPARVIDWLDRVRAGRLPVSHTRRQVWALPGEGLRPLCSSPHAAGRHDRAAAEGDAPAGSPGH
jgi:oxygen-independent coproporphyrinogen-3 oxidase